MSKSVNQVTLLGHLGGDPEFKTLRSGIPVANFSLATSERFKRGEDWQERTEWHRITLYGKLAEIARDYVKKGDRLYVQGRLQTDSWDDNGSTRYRTYIVGNDLTMLSLARGTGAASAPPEHSNQPITDEDIPF